MSNRKRFIPLTRARPYRAFGLHQGIRPNSKLDGEADGKLHHLWSWRAGPPRPEADHQVGVSVIKLFSSTKIKGQNQLYHLGWVETNQSNIRKHLYLTSVLMPSA